MNTSINREWSSITLTVSDLNEEQLKKILQVAEPTLFPAPVPSPVVDSSNADPFTFATFKKVALKKAAFLYFNDYGEEYGNSNKIYTIKYIRELSGLGSKDAKDLVVYAVGDAENPPSWW